MKKYDSVWARKVEVSQYQECEVKDLDLMRLCWRNHVSVTLDPPDRFWRFLTMWWLNIPKNLSVSDWNVQFQTEDLHTQHGGPGSGLRELVQRLFPPNCTRCWSWTGLTNVDLTTALLSTGFASPGSLSVTGGGLWSLLTFTAHMLEVGGEGECVWTTVE